MSVRARRPRRASRRDRTFVDGILESDRDRRIVRTIVDLAERLDIAVVAEGVESDEQATLLASLGCPVAQGYLFAPALPPSALEELLVDPGRASATPDRRPRVRRTRRSTAGAVTSRRA